MLEKFKSSGSLSDITSPFNFSVPMYRSIHLKAFELHDIGISSFADGIRGWSELQYLHLQDTSTFNGLRISFSLPSDFGALSNMEFLALIDSGIEGIPESVCTLNKMAVLHIEWEYYVDTIPHCLGDISSLKQISLDLNSIWGIPLSIFHLPHLRVLSIHLDVSLDYQSLLEYNLPADIGWNDTEAANQWISENFKFNNDTEYWLTRSAICDQNLTELEADVTFRNFVIAHCDPVCEHFDRTNIIGLTQGDVLCQPRLYGDGKC